MDLISLKEISYENMAFTYGKEQAFTIDYALYCS